MTDKDGQFKIPDCLQENNLDRLPFESDRQAGRFQADYRGNGPVTADFTLEVPAPK